VTKDKLITTNPSQIITLDLGDVCVEISESNLYTLCRGLKHFFLPFGGVFNYKIKSEVLDDSHT